MALVKKNIIKIKGKLAGLSFYKINGKDVVRKSYGPSAAIINSNPNYSSVKNNNKEFAGASQISKQIRFGLGNIGKQFQDAYMASRLTGRCRNIISNGKGIIGAREANFKTNQNDIIGFALIKNTALNSIFTATYNLQLSENNTQLNVLFPSINTSDFVKPKSYETHFKITAITVQIADYNYDKKQEKYLPKNKNYNSISANTSTQLLPIRAPHKNTTLSIKGNNSQLEPSKTNTLVWLGISTYSDSNQTESPIVINKAMQCVAVI